jgi:beta-lactam-binding protein with PASTA domain
MTKFEKFKYYLKETGAFLSSKIFLKNFAYMTGIVFVFLTILFWIVFPLYTRHNEEISVPDIRNLKIDKAEKLVKNLGLKIVVNDTVYTPGKSENIIMEQDPVKGSKVKPSRSIYVSISGDKAPLVQITYNKIITRNFDLVAKQLVKDKLKIGRKDYINGKGKNTIYSISQNGRILFREADKYKGETKPVEPISVKKGSKIDFVLYKGDEAEMVEIPELVCKTYDEAVLLVTSSNFLFGEIHFPESEGSDTLSAYIVKQSPRTGVEATMGTAINIWLERRKPEDCDKKAEVEDE